MKKILLILFLLITEIGISQQLEFGPNIEYVSTNIANSRITEGRAVIGESLWNINNGFSIIYYF